MKKRIISLLLTGIMSVAMLAGCSSGGNNKEGADASDGEQTITVWAWDDNFNVAVMKEAAEVYAKEKPDSKVNVDVVSLSKEDVNVKLQTALAGGGSGLPDIVLLEDYVSGKFLQSFEGAFADLTNEFDYSQFLEFKVDAVSKDEKVYAVPFDTGATALYYRIDLIEKAGYSEEDMQDLTWDQFIQIGEDVLAKTGTPMIVEIANNKTTLVRAIMQSCGEWYFDEKGDINIKDNESLKAAFEIIKEMKDKGILFEAESTEGRAGSLNEGTVASVVNAPWFISSLRQAEDQSGLWRATRIPRVAEISTSINASNVGGSSWYVLENSEVKDEAIEFMKTVWEGNTEFYDTIMNNQGAMGSYIPSYETAVYETEDDFFGGQKINALFAEVLPEVKPVNYGGYVAEANDAITTGLANLFSGKVDTDAALEEAENQLANQLGK